MYNHGTNIIYTLIVDNSIVHEVNCATKYCEWLTWLMLIYIFGLKKVFLLVVDVYGRFH